MSTFYTQMYNMSGKIDLFLLRFIQIRTLLHTSIRIRVCFIHPYKSLLNTHTNLYCFINLQIHTLFHTPIQIHTKHLYINIFCFINLYKSILYFIHLIHLYKLILCFMHLCKSFLYVRYMQTHSHTT